MNPSEEKRSPRRQAGKDTWYQQLTMLGLAKLALAACLAAFFACFYAMLPIASLGFLPIFIGCVSLVTSALHDMNFN